MTDQDYIVAALAAVSDLERALRRSRLGQSSEHLVNFFYALSVVSRALAERMQERMQAASSAPAPTAPKEVN